MRRSRVATSHMILECLWRRVRRGGQLQLHLSAEGRSWAIHLIVSIGCHLARRGSIFEGQLGNA